MNPLSKIGISKERTVVVDQLSLLVGSGMPILLALESLKDDVRTKRMKKMIEHMKESIEDGSPLWRALDDSGLFSLQTTSLIRVGEESGKLSENLRVVAAQEEKDRSFRSKIRSAMMYPVFVLSLTVVVGIGIAWFVLPKLALVFGQLNVELPTVTKILIGFGAFLGENGKIAVPIALAGLAIIIYFVFIFPKTKVVGQTLLFSMPGIRRLIQEVELARFGYLLGTLLDAGLLVTQALLSLANAATIPQYRKLYEHLRASVEDGNSFQQSFASYHHIRRLIPATVQALIVSGEQSGHLADTLKSVGERYDAKTELTTKNLATILEPVLLVIVWLGVVAVALAIILPIYSLIGGLGNDGGAPAPPAQVQLVPPKEPVSLPDAIVEEAPYKEPAPFLRVLPTPTGYLNVRTEPSRASAPVTRVSPGEEYAFTAHTGEWYQIVLPDGRSGWVIETYVTRIHTP